MLGYREDVVNNDLPQGKNVAGALPVCSMSIQGKITGDVSIAEPHPQLALSAPPSVHHLTLAARKSRTSVRGDR